MAEQERIEKAVPVGIEKDLPVGIRIEQDGSIIFGNGCLIVKPDGKDLRIKIDDTLCGELTARAYLGLLQQTIGKGGKTLYEVPAKIEEQPDEKLEVLPGKVL